MYAQKRTIAADSRQLSLNRLVDRMSINDAKEANLLMFAYLSSPNYMRIIQHRLYS
jgi:hypothetical protein